MEDQHEAELSKEEKVEAAEVDKIKGAIKEIERLMTENNLTLQVEHIIRIVPRR